MLTVIQDQQHMPAAHWTAASESASDRPGCSRTPNTTATAVGTSPGSSTWANPTSHTPSSNRDTRARATSIATRVLPEPPGPITVTNRCRASMASTRANSDARPIKLVKPTGKLCARSAGTDPAGTCPTI